MKNIMVVSLLLLVLFSRSSMASTCTKPISQLAICVQFLRGGQLSKDCCEGLKATIKDAKTKLDKVLVCKCVQKGLAGVKAYDPNRIPLLAKKCGVAVPLPPVNHKTDCSGGF